MRRRRYIYFTKLQLFIGGLLILAALAGVTYGIVRHYNSAPDILPKTIKQKVAYQVYVPDISDQAWNIPKNSIGYDSKQGILSLTASSGSNNMYITEQNTPDQFNDIPQYYPALLNKLNLYAAVQTSLGEVNLTHPKELSGGQTAVLNSHGTLMFIRPQHNMTSNQWKDFINSMVVVK